VRRTSRESRAPDGLYCMGLRAKCQADEWVIYSKEGGGGALTYSQLALTPSLYSGGSSAGGQGMPACEGCVLFHTNGSRSASSCRKAGMSTRTSTLVCASTHSSVPHSSGGQRATLVRAERREGKRMSAQGPAATSAATKQLPP
jgi:hypothetical protein